MASGFQYKVASPHQAYNLLGLFKFANVYSLANTLSCSQLPPVQRQMPVMVCCTALQTVRRLSLDGASADRLMLGCTARHPLRLVSLNASENKD